MSRDVRILVVDDEEVIRDVLGTLLEREGYDVAVAPTAGYTEDGRRWLAEVTPFLERAGHGHGELVRTR